MRNMFKEVSKVYRTGVIPTQYQLTIEEVDKLYQMTKQNPDGVWKAIASAFHLGFVMGNHCTVNRKMKKI